jgi:tRNA (adenine22-N1)-methyltransferase
MIGGEGVSTSMRSEPGEAVFERDSQLLSARLAAIAERVPSGHVTADIGADHALLLIALAKQGRISKGIAGELNTGPFQNARKRVKRSRVDHLVEVRQGDGLAVLSKGEAETVVIAGMGGSLIASILDKGESRLQGVKRLILQPNNSGDRVRTWLANRGWELMDETLVEEGGILYEVLTAEPGNGDAPYEGSPFAKDQMVQLGPLLCKSRHPLLIKKVKEEIESRKRVLEQLEAGRTIEAERRKQEMKKELRKWEKVMTWLSEEPI